MIEDSEANQAYRELLNAVVERRLTWLCDDVEKQISLGKEITREIQVETTLRTEEIEEPRKRKGRHAKFVVSRQYTPQEKLYLLVEAVEAASVGLSKSLRKTQKTLFESNENITSLGFADDVEGGEMLEVFDSNTPRAPDVDNLEKLILELKEAL